MENSVKEFKSSYDYHRFVLKQIKKQIGEGAEGLVFLTKQNDTIKEITYTKYMYPYKDLIMACDYPLESFLFPNKLYICDNRIIGYRTEYFKNIFRNFDGNISDIDLDSLIQAGYNMIDDIRVLSNDHFVLYDMPYNLLFDGHQLKAIDTLSYYREDHPTFDTNIRILRNSLISALDYHDGFCSMGDKEHYTRVLSKSFTDVK